jgi:hypothetical protein
MNRTDFSWQRAGAAFVALVALVGPTAAGEDTAPPPLAFFAVGDTGAPPEDGRRHAVQLAVGAAMTAADRRDPAAALVLLGDNFYPDGLRRRELVPRLRDNLVRPYCRFVQLDAPRSQEVAAACPEPPPDRQPVSLLAVLGNHDYGSPESPALQREAVGAFVANWRMPAGAATVYELRRGVSIVAFDSTPVFEGADATPLVAALMGAAGPWRILVAHHPFADRDRGQDSVRHARYRGAVQSALAAAGVPVQLVLSAHEHNLQLLARGAPHPGLQVISGGGSGERSLHGRDPAALAAVEEPGFARVELAGSGDEERLVASLYGLPRFPSNLWSDAPRLLARRSVDRAGRISAD